MKQDIEWHRECLKNYRQSCEREKNEFRNRIENFLRSLSHFRIEQRQFDRAVAKKLDGYDRDRFMKLLIPFLESEEKEKNEKKLKRIMEIIEE